METPTVSSRRHGVVLMVVGGVLLGTLGVFVEEAAVHPLTAVWFRCAFGVLALLAWGLGRSRLPELRLPRRAALLAVAGGLLMLLNWALFFAAIQRTSIALATVVFHVQPLWVLVFGMLWLGEPVSLRRIAALLVALLGLGLATGLFTAPQDAPRESLTWGLACAIGGSLSYAAVTLLAKLQRGVSSYALATWQCGVGTIVLAAWPWLHGWPQATAAWGWLAGLGVLHTALAYVLLYGGMQRLPASQIAPLQFVYPACAVLVDAAVYGRVLGPLQLLGVALLGAALWSARPDASEAPTNRATGGRAPARG